MKIFIKNLSNAHLDEIMQIEALSYGEHHWSRDSFVSEIKSPISQYLCALNEQGKTMGYMGMWKVIDEAHITTLAIHPDYRNKGVAQALVISSVENCLEAKIKYITLEVRKSNNAAISLYEKFGFKSLGVRKNYYQDNGEDALIMWTENIFHENFQSLYNKNRKVLEDSGVEIISEQTIS